MMGNGSGSNRFDESIRARIADRNDHFLKEYKVQIESIQDSNGSSFYKKTKLKIGIITDDFMWNYYAGSAELFYVSPENYREIVDVNKIDFLLYVTCWRGLGYFGNEAIPKKAHYYGDKGVDRAFEILEYARKEHVPVVFQSIEDPPSYDRYLPLAKLADVVFTTAEEKIPCYINDTGNNNVFVLRYGINPVLHNPIGFLNKEKWDCEWRDGGCLFAGAWYKRFPERCENTKRLFDSIISSENSYLCVADRRFTEDTHMNWAFPLRYSQYVIPPFEHTELQKVHKLFDFTVNLNSVVNSRTMCAMRVYEVQALGGLILSNYSRSNSLDFPGLFQIFSLGETDRILNGYSKRELINFQLEGIRSLYSKATVFDRLKEICDRVGADGEFRQKNVAVVCDSLDENIMRQFESQSYPIKSLILAKDLDDHFIDEVDYITKFELGRRYPINYLLDMVNAFKYTNVDYVRYSCDLEAAFNYENGTPCLADCLISVDRFTPNEIICDSLKESEGFRIVGEQWDRAPAGHKKICVLVPIVGDSERLLCRCFRSLLRSSVFESMHIVFLFDSSSDSASVLQARELADAFDNVEVKAVQQGITVSFEKLIQYANNVVEEEYFSILDSTAEAINDGYCALLSKIEFSKLDVCSCSSSLPHESLEPDWSFVDRSTCLLDEIGDSALFRCGAVSSKDGVIASDRMACSPRAVMTVRYEDLRYTSDAENKYDLDISIIVPAYNAETTISTCLDSLISQIRGDLSAEIIVVDDGSSDRTKEIASQYSQEYFFIHTLEAEHAGVSAARNLGMEVSRGEFVFFLDADDELSPGTLFAVFDFFKANHDRVDLVCYPRAYVKEGVKTLNYRDTNLFGGTGVYNLSDNPFLSLTTLNVAIKNGLRIRFDTKFELAEDQLFLADIILKNSLIGFVREAEYLCNLHSDSSSAQKNLPSYCYDSMLDFFEEVLNRKRLNPELANYLDSLIVYNLKWRIGSNKLLPYHLKGLEYDKAFHRLVKVVESLSDFAIAHYPGFNSYHQAYLLRLKNSLSVRIVSNNIIVLGDSEALYAEWKASIYVSKLQLIGNKIRICGHFDDIPILFLEDVRLFAVVNDADRLEIQLFHSAYGYRYSHMKVNDTLGFDFEINRHFVSTISFEIGWRDTKVQVRISGESLFSGIRPSIQRYYRQFGDIAVVLSSDKLYLRGSDEKWVSDLSTRYSNFLKSKKPRTYRLRRVIQAIGSMSKKTCWLYNDSKGRFQDAFRQFRHDIKQDDGIERYYIYAGKDKLPSGLTSKEKASIVHFGSSKHKILLFSASLIIASYADTKDWMPFSSNSSQYYIDLLHAKVAYIGHGVMHAYLPRHLDMEIVPWIDYFVVSTNMEKSACLNRLHYKESDLICTGTPRLQKPVHEPKNKILLAPSWRENLVHLESGKWVVDSAFRSSKYYNGLMELMSSEMFIDFLDSNGLTCDLKLHPGFGNAKALFEVGNERISVVDSADPDDYLVLITDISSFQFDFLYKNRPIIYYMRDREEFDCGSHSYNSLLYDLENGFGDYCGSVDECIEALKRLSENEFLPLQQYANKIKDEFILQGEDHSRQLYEELYRLMLKG